MKKILLTGAAGFIGSHMVEEILKNTDWNIVVVDRLDTSGNLNRLTDMDCWEEMKHRVKFVYHDLKAEISEYVGNQIGNEFDYIVHLAAGSHVDRSIVDPLSFVKDNVVGTCNILNFARTNLKKEGIFEYFGTDEVFGPAPEGVAYKEWDRFNPNNPYAASKAGAESLCDSFANTYQMNIITTHCMNVFGERQHPEKFIPMVIKKILNRDSITIHSYPDKIHSGTRFYLHARNISAAIVWLLQNGKCLNREATEGKYNIVGNKEVSNEEMALLVSKYVHEWGEEKGIDIPPINYEMVDFHSSRPGHDPRYSLDGSYLKYSGFEYPHSFEESLKKMIYWTLDNKEKWL